MRALVQDKYALRDLHREIDLLDRKLNHILKFETFATDALRDSAAKKAATKRDQLAAQAQSLIKLGIEYQPAEVPRSLRSAKDNAAIADAEATPAVVAEAIAVRTSGPVASAFGTQISRLERESGITSSPLAAWKDDLLAYKRRRQKGASAA